MSGQLDVRHVTFDERQVLIVEAGALPPDIIVTPDGESRERKRWRRRVEVYVSPTGRSVRVFVDDEEIKP